MHNSYLWLCLETGDVFLHASDSPAKDVSFIKRGGGEPSARGAAESRAATFLTCISRGSRLKKLRRLSPAGEVDAIGPAAP